MDAEKAAVLHCFNQFWKTWAERANKDKTIDDILPFFDQNVSSIGTGEHELGQDLKAVVQNFKDDFLELDMPFSIDFFYEAAKMLGSEVGLVEAEGNVEIKVEAELTLKFHLRFTTVFKWSGTAWLIAHNHVSIPSSEQDIGEAYPIDALKAKNNRLRKLVRQRTEELEEKTLQLQQEKEKTESLLFNILPKKIAKELMQTGKNVPIRHEEVSVIFTDFKGFTKVAATISAQQLVAELNEIFFYFDELVKAEGLEKIKTIGDSYMAVCGLPEPDEAHAFKCIQTARKMHQFLQARNERHPVKWQMRIGIHSGPVVAGVVGTHKFTYDLWGNTVNLASRLEGAGEAGEINVSEQTYQLVKDCIDCEYRGKKRIKGDKMVDMYFIR